MSHILAILTSASLQSDMTDLKIEIKLGKDLQYVRKLTVGCFRKGARPLIMMQARDEVIQSYDSFHQLPSQHSSLQLPM